MANNPLIILTGPTSVGKTALSIQLAKSVNGEIISADSMQVYQYMDIGTAKITPEEMQGIPHYLIDAFAPNEEFNVVKFQQYAKKYIKDIQSRGKIPILVGGTGFYIQAVLYDIDFTENDIDPSYRQELEQMAKEKGAEHLHALLQKVDPISAEKVHPNNIKRVIRALEYHKLTGEKISEHNEEQRNKNSPYQYRYFVLNKDRANLYEGINLRVDQMMQNGLLAEVKELAERGYTKDLVSMQGLGYKELLAFLEGEGTLEDAVELIKKETRHYAKRQITWFKRENDIIWINKDDFKDDTEILAHMLKLLKEKNIV
ncbi:MAG: tRNA (adenosine(37)-N6)-dimethylallyltransferase MiaA [Lachnospiraceae bacterium]|jgi:tRNA dimethylallyltransferase|nr:tRNA (adenosine(37)-N6)-dimethylallyltransferase MiaA [Lachnospiraceae bacterium]